MGLLHTRGRGSGLLTCYPCCPGLGCYITGPSRPVRPAVTAGSSTWLPGVEGGEDLPGELGGGGGDELLAWCHGLGDAVEGVQVVVEGERLAVGGEGGAAG